jgi:hypothetical protein
MLGKMNLLGKHLIILDRTFRKRGNYSDIGDYQLYEKNLNEFEKIAKK